MRYLLDIVYLIALVAASPFLIYKSLTTGKYRRGIGRKLFGLTEYSVLSTQYSERPVAWFHGVSVGEIHLLRQVIARFRQRHPKWECVVSTTTDTGYDEVRKRFPDLEVFFWPLDFSGAVRRALRRVRPALVVLAEGELWPNFLLAARREGVPVAVINGRMSPRSFARYRRLGWLARHLVGLVDAWAVQTEEYAAHVRELGAPANRVHVTGSVKYDGVEGDRQNARTRQLAELLQVQPDNLLWIAGSTQAPEEETALDIFLRLRPRLPQLRLILVPRQKERFEEVAALLRRRDVLFFRRSEIGPASGHPLLLSSSHPVVLVDTIGELGALWGLADVAFVGGSLDGRRGGQNMIEPAGYGAAVLFGPHVWNFKETAAQLVAAGGAVQVADAAGLEKEVARLLADASERRHLGETAQRFVQSQQGATERTLDVLDALIAEQAPRKAAA